MLGYRYNYVYDEVIQVPTHLKILCFRIIHNINDYRYLFHIIASNA